MTKKNSKRRLADLAATYSGICGQINAALTAGAVLTRSTAFGLVRVASVRYASDGIWYSTGGSWMSARSFAIDGGVLLEMARTLGIAYTVVR